MRFTLATPGVRLYGLFCAIVFDMGDWYIVAEGFCGQPLKREGNDKWQKFVLVRTSHLTQLLKDLRDHVQRTALLLKYVKESIMKSLR